MDIQIGDARGHRNFWLSSFWSRDHEANTETRSASIHGRTLMVKVLLDAKFIRRNLRIYFLKTAANFTWVGRYVGRW